MASVLARFGLVAALVAAASFPEVLVAQVPTTAVEDEPEPEGPPPTAEEIDARRGESRKRRKAVVIPNRPAAEANMEDEEPTEETESVPSRKRARDEDDDGPRTNPRTVGLALTISGLIVGLGAGAVGAAGGITGDQPTQITAAVLAGVGGSLSVAGLIVMLTASSSGTASAPTPVWIGVSPTSASVFGTF